MMPTCLLDTNGSSGEDPLVSSKPIFYGITTDKDTYVHINILEV